MAWTLVLSCLLSVSLLADTAPLQQKQGQRVHLTARRRAKRDKVEYPLDEFLIVYWHNYYRRKALASDMEYVKYNDILAERALWWAMKCNFYHVPPEESPFGGSPPRTTLKPFVTNYGQNLHHISETLVGDDLTERALGAWYTEGQVYLAENDTCLIDSCRQYKQLMWAGVREVGCAAVRCDRLRTPYDNNYANELFLVCNYDERQMDGRPFQSGYPCSNCSEGEASAKCDKGLCRRDGKGMLIARSDDLVLDPTNRPTTKKPREPTLPPDIKQYIESHPDPVERSPSVSNDRSSITPALARTLPGLSNQTLSPSAPSVAAAASGRTLPTSNTPAAYNSSQPSASASRTQAAEQPGVRTTSFLQPAGFSSTEATGVRTTPASAAMVTRSTAKQLFGGGVRNTVQGVEAAEMVRSRTPEGGGVSSEAVPSAATTKP